MLNAQEVANYLNKKLDEIGLTRAEPYEFSLFGEVACGYKGRKVNGMVVTVSADHAPVKGYAEVNYVFAVELLVGGSDNYNYLNVKDVVDELIRGNQDAVVEFTNGNGIVTFTSGVPKGYEIRYKVGESVPLTFTVFVTYTENAVTSGDKHWLLDGIEIPFLSESVTVENEGIPRKIYTEVYSKILLTGKTKFYTFRIPYESKTYKSLQQEIMNAREVGGIVHTLSYYDGAAFTEDDPYTTKVAIYRSASSASARPNGSVYEVTFSDVYNADGQSLKYSIALIDFPFDMNGDDTRYFTSMDAQKAYFEDKAANSTAPFVEIMAPNLDNLVITQQVYYNPAASALTQFDYASKNYAIIKVEAETETRYFYYFIEKATIGANGYMLCDLKLDTVQTYFFNPDITFSDCLIERAHLNRFVEDETDSHYVKFVSDPASKIFNSEEGLSFPKRLVSREKLNLRFTENPIVDKWLNDNVAYWVYIFIDPTHEYKVVKPIPGERNYETMSNEYHASTGLVRYPIGMDSATNCICYPIYKNDEHLILCEVSNETGFKLYVQMDKTGKHWFEEQNPNDRDSTKSFYYSIKLSIVPPFSSVRSAWIKEKNLIISCTHKSKNLLFFEEDDLAAKGFRGIRTVETDDANSINVIADGHSYGVFWGAIQDKTQIRISRIQIDENEQIFVKNILDQQVPNLTFNPKLNGQNFKELAITASSGDVFSYDIQKLAENIIGFEYTEPITPEITKYYLRVTGGTGLYEEGTEKNYTGLVGSTDNGLVFTNDQYAAFIANNKNFFLQSNIKIGSNLVSGITNGAQQLALSAFSLDVNGMASGENQIKSSVVNAALSVIDRSLTIDNLKNAPDQLKNANGNVIFNLFSMSENGTELGLYVEKHSALEGDLKTANDFMNIYGFSFNAVANVRDYAHIRKYHNYLKAQLQSINGNLSNMMRDDLRQRFAQGVRFWNSDTVEYKYENYELWLENGLIFFTVCGAPYMAKEGSTWREFIQDPYSCGKFNTSNNTVFLGMQMIKLYMKTVTPDEKIEKDAKYTI